MRRLPLFMLTTALSAGLLASCSETTKPAASQGGTRKLIPSNMVADAPELASNSSAQQTRTPAGFPAAPAPAAPQQVNTSELPDAPAGAQWTLYCQTIKGPGHVEQTRDAVAQLIRSTGMKGWYAIHAGDASNLYFGFYASIDPSERSENRKDGVRAQQDRKRIDALKDSAGERPFARCMFVELAAPDPEAPPEWNLANAPRDAFWSVQIAAYEHSADRKKYAVDAVRDARARGIEAYYYHGASVSSVCVGAWPLEAVRYDTGRGMASNPNQSLLILPPGLPPMSSDVRDKDGQRMWVAKNEVEIVDPSMIATLRKYPTHSINGVERMLKGNNGTQRPEPSFMVRVPNRFIEGERPDDRVQAATPENTGDGFSWLRPQNQGRDQSRDYIPGNRGSQSSQGAGRLRSLDR